MSSSSSANFVSHVASSPNLTREEKILLLDDLVDRCDELLSASSRVLFSTSPMNASASSPTPFVTVSDGDDEIVVRPFEESEASWTWLRELFEESKVRKLRLVEIENETQFRRLLNLASDFKIKELVVRRIKFDPCLFWFEYMDDLESLSVEKCTLSTGFHIKEPFATLKSLRFKRVKFTTTEDLMLGGWLPKERFPNLTFLCVDRCRLYSRFRTKKSISDPKTFVRGFQDFVEANVQLVHVKFTQKFEPRHATLRWGKWFNRLRDNVVLESFFCDALMVHRDVVDEFVEFLEKNSTLRRLGTMMHVEEDDDKEDFSEEQIRRMATAYVRNDALRIHFIPSPCNTWTMRYLKDVKDSDYSVGLTWTRFAAKVTKTSENGDKIKFACEIGLVKKLCEYCGYGEIDDIVISSDYSDKYDGDKIFRYVF